MMNPESKRPVTVEGLLRLKRAERPAPEFWARFEKELRAKQLAAIVEKRPWWSTMPRLLGNLRRYQVPLGASAILAVTFISVQHYRLNVPLSQPAAPATAPAEELLAASDTAAPAGSAVNAAAAYASAAENSPMVASASDTSSAVVAIVSSSGAMAPGRLAEVVPWLSPVRAADSESAMPAMQSIVAANLETVKAAHPELARKFLGRAAGYETELDHKPAVDPFTRLRGPAELKRDRLLAKALPASVDTSWNGGERIARHLSEQRLTEEAISRIGGAGDRLSLKF